MDENKVAFTVPAYPSNTDKTVKPTASGTKNITPVQNAGKLVTPAEKSLGRQIFDEIFVNSAKDVGNYVLHDVLIPYFKDTVYNIIMGGLNAFFYNGKKSVGRAFSAGQKAFNANATADVGISTAIGPDRRFDFVNVAFPTKDDADDALEKMQDILDEYPTVSVANFYSIAGVKNDNYMANDWGWRRGALESATVGLTPNGYVITFPKVRALK